MLITQETNDLLEQVLDDKDKILFKEALGCLEHKFYRTGYIAAWITITESIKRKIITLSEIGDKAAIAAVVKIREEEAKEQSIDKLLIKYAKDLSLIEEGEHADLEFFWSKRCLFAHPYESAPEQTDLLYILQQSVALVLEKPVFYKKSFIESYILNLKDKAHYLPDDPAAIIAHIAQTLPRIATASQPVLFHTLFAALGAEIDLPNRQKYQQRMEIWLVLLLQHLAGKLDQPEWKLEEKALSFPQTAVYSFLDEQVYALIPNRVKQILLEFACDEKDGIHYEVARQQFARRIGEGMVITEHKARFEAYLEAHRFAEVHYYYTAPKAYASRLVSELQSGDFYRQTPVINALQNPESDELLRQAGILKLREIGRQVHQAAVFSSWAAQAFLKGEHVGRHLGILIGAFESVFFNINGQLHLRYEYFTELLLQFNELDSLMTSQVLAELRDKAITAEIANIYNIDYLQKAFEHLNKAGRFSPSFIENLSALLGVLAERKQQYYNALMKDHDGQ